MCVGSWEQWTSIHCFFKHQPQCLLFTYLFNQHRLIVHIRVVFGNCIQCEIIKSVISLAITQVFIVWFQWEHLKSSRVAIFKYMLLLTVVKPTLQQNMRSYFSSLTVFLYPRTNLSLFSSLFFWALATTILFCPSMTGVGNVWLMGHIRPIKSFGLSLPKQPQGGLEI